MVLEHEPGPRQDTAYRTNSRWAPRGDLFGASDVYEILVYDRVLTEMELKVLHQYLLALRPRPDSDSTRHN